MGGRMGRIHRLITALACACLFGPLSCRGHASSQLLGFCPAWSPPAASILRCRDPGAGVQPVERRMNLRRMAVSLPSFEPPGSRRGLGLRMAAGFEVRKAPMYVGGVGRFMRSPEYLQRVIDQLTFVLESDLLPALRDTESKVLPKEEQLRVLRKEYEETESTIVLSQIRPIELKLMPFQELLQEQQSQVEEQESEIEDVKDLRDKAKAKHVEDGVVDVEYAGFGEKIWPVQMQRNMGWSPAGAADEVDLTVSGGGAEDYTVTAKWQTRLETQPLVVEAEEGKPQLVLSFATPDEGPKRLCAVAEWNGETKGEEVEQKRREMLTYLRKDQLVANEPGTTRVNFFSDPNPFRRRNELWFEVEPPTGAGWYDHATHIATDRVAKNSSFYQLKDCPWAVVRAFASSEGFEQPERGVDMSFKWSSNTFLQSNTFQCSVPRALGGALAIDKSSTGEVAVSLAFERSEEAGPIDEYDCEDYGVGSVIGWPLSGGNVEKARQALLSSVEASGRRPLDPQSFRVVVKSPSQVEIWMRLQGDEK